MCVKEGGGGVGGEEVGRGGSKRAKPKEDLLNNCVHSLYGCPQRIILIS